MTDLTQQERDIVRSSAFGAMALVSMSEPGFFAMFKESAAGSRALAQAPEQIREVLQQGGFPTPPTGSREDVERSVLAQLGEASRILGAKSAELRDGFHSVILAACDAVAQAAKGVSAEETAVIDKVRAALAGEVQDGAPATPAGPAPGEQPQPGQGGLLGT